MTKFSYLTVLTRLAA